MIEKINLEPIIYGNFIEEHCELRFRTIVKKFNEIIDTINEISRELDGQQDIEKMNMPTFKRIDDMDTSTLICICGKSFTWHGAENDGLEEWKVAHRKHLLIKTDKDEVSNR
jgi:hypothetical protein